MPAPPRKRHLLFRRGIPEPPPKRGDNHETDFFHPPWSNRRVDLLPPSFCPFLHFRRLPKPTLKSTDHRRGSAVPEPTGPGRQEQDVHGNQRPAPVDPWLRGRPRIGARASKVSSIRIHYDTQQRPLSLARATRKALAPRSFRVRPTPRLKGDWGSVMLGRHGPALPRPYRAPSRAPQGAILQPLCPGLYQCFQATGAPGN